MLVRRARSRGHRERQRASANVKEKGSPLRMRLSPIQCRSARLLRGRVQVLHVLAHRSDSIVGRATR